MKTLPKTDDARPAVRQVYLARVQKRGAGLEGDLVWPELIEAAMSALDVLRPADLDGAFYSDIFLDLCNELYAEIERDGYPWDTDLWDNDLDLDGYAWDYANSGHGVWLYWFGGFTF